MVDLFAGKLYHADQILLTKVLPTTPMPTRFPHGERVTLGTYTRYSEHEPIRALVEVTIQVLMVPACFWTFTVTPTHEECEAQHVKLTTGSGALVEYWPMVMLFAAGMLHVRELSPADGSQDNE